MNKFAAVRQALLVVSDPDKESNAKVAAIANAKRQQAGLPADIQLHSASQCRIKLRKRYKVKTLTHDLVKKAVAELDGKEEPQHSAAKVTDRQASQVVGQIVQQLVEPTDALEEATAGIKAGRQFARDCGGYDRAFAYLNAAREIDS